MVSAITGPTHSIAPGGCLPPLDPIGPRPWERNCWAPRDADGNVILPTRPESVSGAERAASLVRPSR